VEGSAVDPTITLIVAFLGMLGLVLGPVLVALINRGGKAKALDLPPDKVMPRAEYDGLLEQMARLDDENDRLARENGRLRDELSAEVIARALSESKREKP